MFLQSVHTCHTVPRSFIRFKGRVIVIVTLNLKLILTLTPAVCRTPCHYSYKWQLQLGRGVARSVTGTAVMGEQALTRRPQTQGRRKRASAAHFQRSRKPAKKSSVTTYVGSAALATSMLGLSAATRYASTATQ